MKKTINQVPLNSKVGKSWTLDSQTTENNDLPQNFIMGMTNQKIKSD